MRGLHSLFSRVRLASSSHAQSSASGITDQSRSFRFNVESGLPVDARVSRHSLRSDVSMVGRLLRSIDRERREGHSA